MAGYELSGKRVWVAGHRGMVGSALVRRLGQEDCEILTVPRETLDLADSSAVLAWMAQARPQAVLVAAARVGGIHANSTYPASFIQDNLAVSTSVIEGAWKTGVEKLLYLGSSCIYPRNAPQPIREEALLTGPLEPTNEFYAIAKIAGLKLCQGFRRQYGSDFISAMPTNLYGPGDNFHPENSHMPAALLRRFHEAKAAGASAVTVWGTGTPRREFLHVDDLADACIFLMRHYSEEQHINVGTGTDITVRDFAGLIRETVGFEGVLAFDTSRPDGMPRKVMDVGRLNALGWAARTPLEEGLRDYYHWFLAHRDGLRL